MLAKGTVTSMSTNRDRIIITGGAGFLGDHLLSKFRASGSDAFIYDPRSPTLPEGTTGDVFNEEELNHAIKGCQCVIHLAGLADAGIAQNEPLKSFQLNVASLQVVLEACRVHGVKKIVFPSSAAVYGVAEDLPIKEGFPLKPTNIYSWHKCMCESLLKAYYDNFGMDHVILRMFNVYGRGNKGVVSVFIEKAKRGEVIESFGSEQYRDMVYAGDVVDALYKAATSDKANNRIINIGSGQGTQISTILNMVCGNLPGAKWVSIKAPFTRYDSIADITLAKILLDFEPRGKDFLKGFIEEEIKGLGTGIFSGS